MVEIEHIDFLIGAEQLNVSYRPKEEYMTHYDNVPRKELKV